MRHSAGKQWEENTAEFDCVADRVFGGVSDPPHSQSGK